MLNIYFTMWLQDLTGVSIVNVKFWILAHGLSRFLLCFFIM